MRIKCTFSQLLFSLSVAFVLIVLFGSFKSLIASEQSYFVTLTGGKHSTCSPSKGMSQTGLTGPMETVTFTADYGYYFKEFETRYVNGFSVKWVNDTVITISGTPLANTSITIPDAEEIPGLLPQISFGISLNGSKGYETKSTFVKVPEVDEYIVSYQWYYRPKGYISYDPYEGYSPIEGANNDVYIPTGKPYGTTESYYCDITFTRKDNGKSITVTRGISTLSIGKTLITVSGIKADNKQYDGNKNATLDFSNVFFHGKHEGDNLIVTATGTFDDENVGENKTVRINDLKIVEDKLGIYELAVDGCQTTTKASILPNSFAITVTGYIGTYDGEAHGISISTEEPNVMLTYAEKGDGIYTEENLKYTNAGTYKVYYKAQKTGYITISGSEELVIKKTNSTPAKVTENNRVFDGMENPLITYDNSTLVGGTMQYAIGVDTVTVPTTGWNTSIPTASDVGIYYVWYKVVGDENHFDSVPACVIAKIAEKTTGESGTEDLNTEDTNAGGLSPEEQNTGGLNPMEQNPGRLNPEEQNTGGSNPEDPNAGGSNPEEPNVGGLKPEETNAGGLNPGESHAGGLNPDEPTTGGLNPEEPNVGGINPEEPESEESKIDDPKINIFNDDETEAETMTSDQKHNTTPAGIGNSISNTATPVTIPSETLEEPMKAEMQISASIYLNSRFLVYWSGSNVKVKWGAVPEADSYEIYANYCGKNKCVRIDATSSTSITLIKLNGKKLKSRRIVKAYVIAYKNGTQLGRTILGHAAGLKSRYTNAKAVTIDQCSYQMKTGECAKISCSITKEKKNRKLPGIRHGARLRYASTNEGVATVDKNGMITGTGAGSCEIWIYALNGRSAKVDVSVS